MKKKRIDYLIVAPLSTQGQTAYYLERKKMLIELGYTTEILSIPYNIPKMLIMASLINLIYSFKYRSYLTNYLKKNDPKIIEFQNTTALFQRDFIFKKYITIISFDYPYQFQDRWYSYYNTLLENRIFCKAFVLISRSSYVYDILVKKYNKMYFLPHTISGLKKIKKKTLNSDYILAYCKDYEPYNSGLDILIKCWKLIKKSYRLKLVIAGISKNQAIIYLNKINLKIPNNVIFLGKIDRKNLFSYVRGSKFIIRTARVEPFGRFTLECLFFKKIIFSTPTTGAIEILQEYDKKMISKSFESDELYKTITKYPHENQEFLQKAYNVLQIYNYNRVKQQINNIINANLHSGN